MAAVEGMLERRRVGVGTCGRAASNCWRGRIQRKKILNKKYTVTLGGRRSMNLHTTANQKQVPIMEESKERRGDHRGSAGGCKSIVFGAIAVK
jgi:hypothetical protein